MIDVTRQLFGAGSLPSLEAPRDIVVGDFNGDGRPDIFIAGTGYDASPFLGETNVLLVSNPDGTYADRSSTLPQAPDYSHSACAGDINGDGRLDIYVGNIDGRVGAYLLLGKGDGTFVQTRQGLPATIVPAPDHSVSETFLSCLMIDADGDGFDDLVLGAANPNGSPNSVIYFNDGAGDFTKRPRYVLPTHPIGAGNVEVLHIATLDVNRDGWPDLVLVATQNNPPAGNGLQILINNRDGTFTDETAARLGPSAVVRTGSSCGFLRLADFNGDGWEDFYCNIGPTDVANRYWISNGDGTWSPLASNALSQGSGFGIHAVDFDGDGRPDLLQFAHTATGDIAYQSFLNRTARSVPSEPIAGVTLAGDARATISFAPPRSDGTAAITSYTATCSSGASSGVVTASGVASPIAVTGLTNGVRYVCSVFATTAAGNGPHSTPVHVTPGVAVTHRLANISTRMQVLTGNNVMIGGFVIGGSAPKKVAIVATGPSLSAFGIANPLLNPTLTLVRSSDQTIIATNDDWQTASNSAQLQAAGFAPSNPLEAAILTTLPPGAYTAIVSGVGTGTGVGLVAVYEIDHPEIPLTNISTRGEVLTGNDVMIGGFVIQGNSPQTVAVVATGPSLGAFGITNPLSDPTLTLVRSSDQTVIGMNDDWQSASNAAQLQAAGFAPSNPKEAAMLVTLDPGAYTAIVSGTGGAMGVSVVAVYAVP